MREGRALGLAVACVGVDREVCICYTHAHKSQASSATKAAFHPATTTARSTSTSRLHLRFLQCAPQKKKSWENIHTHFWDQFVNLTRRGGAKTT